jgi:hypothetical protein
MRSNCQELYSLIDKIAGFSDLRSLKIDRNYRRCGPAMSRVFRLLNYLSELTNYLKINYTAHHLYNFY